MTTTTLASVDLEVLKQAHRIADVVRGSGVRLKGRGRAQQGLCPFHEDSEPSFTVYQDTERFYCFGSGASGDVLDYLQLSRRMGLPEVIRLLQTGTPVTTTNGHRRLAAADRFEPLASGVPDTAVLGTAARFYATQLRRHRPAVAYLASRGTTIDTAVRLGLGYAPGSGLRGALAAAGLTAAAVEGSGLFIGDHERFAGRVVVPDLVHGHVTWMVGRAIDPTTEPRFQALPGPKPVLGIDRLAGSRTVVLAEGLFDWLALVQWGLPACVTLGGHSLERVVTALCGRRRVYLAMDTDDAGREATGRLTALLGPRAVPVTLPDGIKDVADLAVIPDGQRLFLGALRRAWRAAHS